MKKAAIAVAMEVLLTPPPYVDLTTSMNLLFAGNPGTGKTTVAKLLAQIMVDLKYTATFQNIYLPSVSHKPTSLGILTARIAGIARIRHQS